VPRYADDSRDKVREATDIVELIGSRTELKRAGPGRFKGLCPFHDERTPSFSVNATDGFFHCFGCGKGGDVFTFVQETEGLDFVGALESLAQRNGIELEVADEDPKAAERRQRRERLLALTERATLFYERWFWDSEEAAPAREYLLGRGLTEETLRTFRVGYAPSAWDTLLNAARREGFGNKEIFDAGLAVRSSKGQARIYDRFRRRIMFPLADTRGRVIGFGARALGADQQPKYLNSADGELFHKGNIVYGAHLARASAAKAGEVIAVEGYTDVLALHQAGIENVVCVMGTAMTDQQLSELAKLGERVLLALDADSAGQEAMIRAERVAQGKRLQLRVVPLPDGLDPAELAQQRGADALWEAMGSSVPFVRFRVMRELDTADLSGAEGKDAVIARLAPVFAAVPPSAMREELLEIVAGRLELQPALVSSWLPAPGGSPAAPPRPAAAAQVPGPSPTAHRPAALPPVVAAERDLLVACVAEPTYGAPVLAALDRDRFSSDGMWRVVSYLREHLDAPMQGLPDDDDRLRQAVAGIAADAAEMDGVACREVVEAQVVAVDIAVAQREIERAIADGSTEIAGLRLRRDELVAEKERLIASAMQASGR
jgi:DNA primase